MRTPGIFTVALSLLVLGAGCASNDDDDVDTVDESRIQYLGLGDSIAYGQNGFVEYTEAARPDNSGYVGYPDLVGSEEFAGRYVNLGCPGATTASFADANAADNGCRFIQENFPNTLHVPYTVTQAAKADEFLLADDVDVITLSLGGNDLLLTLADCTTENPEDANAALLCAITRIPQVLDAGAENLAAIFAHFEEVGFRGKLIYVNIYSTVAPDAPATAAVKAWNTRMTPVVEQAGGVVADAFSAFASDAEAADGDPCARGLLIPNPVNGEEPACDAHPSEQGARLLAATVNAALAAAR